MKKQFLVSLKSGAIFGAVMGALYLVMGIIPSFIGGFKPKVFLEGLLMGILSGLFCAVIFSVLIFAASFFLAKNFDKVRNEIAKEKKIVFDEAANRVVGSEAVGGWLFLLEGSIYFKSHAVNIKTHDMEIPLSDITSVERCRVSRLANNGLLVKTVYGVEEKFVVNSPAEWVEKVYESIK